MCIRDSDAIATAKREVAAPHSSAHGADECAVQFVSTNDILCSTFARMTNARTLMLPMNLRGKVPGFEETLAGNYECAFIFDKSVCTTPATFRDNLLKFRECMARSVEKAQRGAGGGPQQQLLMPPSRMLPCLTDRYCFITNWASNHKDLVLPGCVEVLHTLMGDTEMLKKVMPHDMAVVFRARPGQLGVTVLSKLHCKHDILREMPLKEFAGGALVAPAA